MASGLPGAAVRDIQTLFDSGTASGLTDRQLLERFTGRRDNSAEAAFEGLVTRHGPMVLRVCRNVLGDSTDAQDAFQATFLVLVKRHRSIRRLESVGSWLYGVACRVAARAKVEAARRRAAERRGALRVVQAVDSAEANETDQAEFGPIVQEEVSRLPEQYRAVVALCYWQGLTQEQAAVQLGCPLGTVRSRLARARSKLHGRLLRRGLAPLAAGVSAALDHSASASVMTAASRLPRVPPDLVQSTVRAAAEVAAGKATAQATTGAIAALVGRMLRDNSAMKIGKAMTACCCAGLLLFGMSMLEKPPKERTVAARSPKVARETSKRPEPRRYGPAHIVEPPDLVIVEVLDALPGRPISGERLVRPDGTVSLGFYGDVHVAGLTVPEVKEKIILHLRRYLTDATLGLADDDAPEIPFIDENTLDPRLRDPKLSTAVFVDVTAYNSGVYYVEGEVNYPGSLPFTGGENVLDVIHFASGLTSAADQSKIRLIRSFPRGSPAQVMPIDYDEVVMGTDSSTNYQIMPNDRLVVPRKLDDQSTKRAAARRPAPNPSLEKRSASPGAGQHASLQELERHLNEVDKKLDTLIEAMKSVNEAPRRRPDRKVLTRGRSSSQGETNSEAVKPSNPE